MATDLTSSNLKVLLLGNRYVYWVGHYIEKGCNDTPRNMYLTDCDVTFMGFLDATVTVAFLHTDAVFDRIRHANPDVVILSVGADDIDSVEVIPQLVGMDVYSLARDIVHLGVSKVIVCQVLRQNKWRHISYDEGTNKVCRINEFLCAACSGEDNVLIWKFKGMLNSENDIYQEDGIHLNELGNYKFFRSIRGAIIQAFKWWNEDNVSHLKETGKWRSLRKLFRGNEVQQNGKL